MTSDTYTPAPTKMPIKYQPLTPCSMDPSSSKVLSLVSWTWVHSSAVNVFATWNNLCWVGNYIIQVYGLLQISQISKCHKFCCKLCLVCKNLHWYTECVVKFDKCNHDNTCTIGCMRSLWNFKKTWWMYFKDQCLPFYCPSSYDLSIDQLIAPFPRSQDNI